MNDTELLNFLEKAALGSLSGISFDTHKDAENNGMRQYRAMRYHLLGDFKFTLREAIQDLHDKMAAKALQQKQDKQK